MQSTGEGFLVSTDRGSWCVRQVVVATGDCDRPHRPPQARGIPPSVLQVTPSGCRNPATLPPGGVLVVGAGAAGVQIADELARGGRQVVLAVGRHTRAPRTYRGKDIWWWLQQLGTLDTTIEQVRDPRRARQEPSLQLVDAATVGS